MKKVLFMLVCAFAVLTANAQSMYVMSQKGNINIRTAPSTAASKLATLSASDLVPCIEELDGWYKINFDGRDGYVSNSVAMTCDAVIPEEMLGIYIDSSQPWDKIRNQGTIRIDKLDKSHALIYMEWMRVNLLAESLSYLAEIKDGKILATHSCGRYIDSSLPISQIKGEIDNPLERPIPVGFDEFNNTLYFNGAVFSEYN